MDSGYSVRVAALALDVPVKWIDNVLSHHELVGVSRTTHGVPRRLDDNALLALALCRTLAAETGMPIARAASLARDIVESGGRVAIGPGVALDVALDDVRRGLRARAIDAAEAVFHVRRGRPRRLRPVVE